MSPPRAQQSYRCPNVCGLSLMWAAAILFRERGRGASDQYRQNNDARSPGSDTKSSFDLSIPDLDW